MHILNFADGSSITSDDFGNTEPRSKGSFVGHIRQLLFNKKPYIELASQGNALYLLYKNTFEK